MIKLRQDISIVLCGAAGQGIQTIEELLVSIFKMSGYHVFATKEYMSRVRGGLNSTEIRIGSGPVQSFVKRIDLLIPMKEGAIEHLGTRINSNTQILFDKDLMGMEEVKGLKKVDVELIKTARDVGKKIYSNIVAVGVLTGIFNANKNTGINIIRKRFEKKGEKIIDDNLKAFQRGIEIGKKNGEKLDLNIEFSMDEDISDEILLNGNQAVGLGALAGGCNFVAAYPMSPSTGTLVFLAQASKEFNIVLDQVESEISAINKVIGAWYAGARAIASTSGGGLALMEEGISLAGMTETPAVIHIAQRPGPATGLPTRTGQEDLNLVLNAGHGEFGRIMYAPGTIEQAFRLTAKAFNMADTYQVPVFILSDQYFVDSYYNIPNLDLSQVEVEKHIIETKTDYKRYAFTENGISPRGVPGFGEGLVKVDSDEHTESGHITEDMKEIRPKMVEKRYFNRMELLRESAEMPSWIGPEDADNVVVCWGSTYQTVKEVLDKKQYSEVAMVHFHQVFPLNPEVPEILGGYNDSQSNQKQIFSIEANASGQFSKFLKMEANITIPPENQYLKYVGEPFSVEEIEGFTNGKKCKGLHNGRN